MTETTPDIKARYERWIDGRVQVFFYRNGSRITHDQAHQLLTRDEIKRLKLDAAHESATRRKEAEANPLNRTRVATVNKLTRRGGA